MKVLVVNLILPYIVNFIIFWKFPESKIFISFEIIILNFLLQFLLLNLKFILSRIFISFWYYNYVFGMIYLNNSNLRDIKFFVKDNHAEYFYMLCLIFLVIGMLINDKKIFLLSRLKNKYLKNDIHKILWKLILIFPLAFGSSIIYNLGFIPILLKNSSLMDIYNFDYGIFYPYKIILALSSFFFLIRFRQNNLIKWGAVIIILGISLFDGKRAVALIILFSFLVYNYSQTSVLVSSRFFLIPLFVMSTIYITISFVRSEKGIVDLSDGIIQNFPIGVEFTDYVYSFNNYTPGKVKGYSFVESSLGAFVNSDILYFLGFNKNQLVKSGSAYVWREMYGIDDGIRTGIICELYFAYEYFTFVLIFLFGLFMNFINRKILETDSLLNLILYSIFYSLLILSIVGQATVLFGSLTTLLYVLFINKCLFKIVH